MEKITSAQNARVKAWTALHQKKERDRTGLFLVEGEHLISEALRAGAVQTVLTDTQSPFVFEHTIEVTPQIMHKVSANVSDVHLIAVCKQKTESPKRRRRMILLDGIQDPGNLGTIVRTAVSFGYDAVYCSKDTCDLYNEKAIRSTQGALFHIPVIRADLSDIRRELSAEGFEIVATSLEESETMAEIVPKEKMAFIFGNEGQGVSRKLQEDADRRLRIEMEGFESLNVAVAAGIVMYHYR